jgi:hypothetical protein
MESPNDEGRFEMGNRNVLTKLATILFVIACFGLLLTVQPVAARRSGNDTATSGVTEPAVPNRISRLEYHDLWRKLWEDHITWTRVVILGILDDIPGTPAFTQRLLQNPGDMADALRRFYGEDADELGGLITDHLVIAAQILQAIHDGQPTDDLIAQWYANANDIAAKMNQMNPHFWPLDDAQTMWREHLDATVAEVLAHHNGDYQAEVAAYDLVHDMALEMADFFSDGVMQQFPRMFKGRIK